MKRMLFFVGVFFSSISYAQDVYLNDRLSVSSNCVVGNSAYAVTEFIYTNDEIGDGYFTSPSNGIEKIGFNVAQLPLNPADAIVDSFRIYMKDVSPLQTSFPFSGAYNTTGYTLVFNGTFNPATITPDNFTFYQFSLIAPYVRNYGTNLQILVERVNNVIHPGFSFFTYNGSEDNEFAFSARVYNGTVAPVSGTTTLTQTFKRPSISLSHPVPVDVGIKEITSPASTCFNAAQSIGVVVTNYGTDPIAAGALQVTLKVGGANSYFNSQLNSITLNKGQSETINFSGVNLENPGENLDTAFTTLVGDAFGFNDTLNKSHRTSEIILYTVSGSDTTLNVEENVETGLLPSFPYVQLVDGNEQLWKVQEGEFSGFVNINPFSGSSGNKYFLFDPVFSVTQLDPLNPTTENWESRLYSNCMVIPPTSSSYKTYITFNMTHDGSTPSDFDDSLYVTISDDRGQSWTTVGGYGRVDVSVPGDAVWRTEEIELPASYGGKTVQVGFLGKSKFGHAFGLDDINVLTRPTASKQITFEANRNSGNSVRLHWSVSGIDGGVRQFFVEKSADGKEYTAINETTAFSSPSTTYSYTDEKLFRGNNFYRLKIVSGNGKYEYSRVRKIQIADNTEMGISPNPVASTMTLYFESEQNELIQIQVMDVSGRVVLTHKANIANGGSKIDIPVRDLPKGQYYVITNLNGIRLAKKMIKQ